MSTLRIGLLTAGLLAMGTAAQAAVFTNGNFETGDFTGWSQGGGYWQGEWPIDPAQYQPGGAKYDPSYIANGIVTPGLDPRTDNNLNMVYSGNYSARINDSYNNNSISTITQTVSNYTDPNIYFAWAAVLEESHGLTDSGNFTLTLIDETTGAELYNRSYSSASAAGTSLFTQSSSGWYYTAWQVENLDVSAYIGHDFTLSLLASDCPYGGHAGYVYLDGFGAVVPPPTGEVPEPAALSLLGAGLAGLGLLRRRKSA